jgi:anti-anti-sigma regulatory factor
MLRITRIPGTSTTTLKVEGKLLAPWLDEFQTAVSNDSSTVPISLDLSGVTFVDTAGLEVLAAMIRRGLVVSSCSNFVAALLQTVKS